MIYQASLNREDAESPLTRNLVSRGKREKKIEKDDPGANGCVGCVGGRRCRKRLLPNELL
jgi:hypothetical protein